MAAEKDNTYTATERIYVTLPDGRSVLAAAEGDVLPIEKAKELGLVGKRPKPEQPEDEFLTEGLRPRSGEIADARATGDTAEARARKQK